MLFNSYIFVFAYLPLTLVSFFMLAKHSHAYSIAWLALASVVFYGYWNPAYVGLLLGSIIFNYMFGIWIANARVKKQYSQAKTLLVIALVSDLALLAYYKYANFFIEVVAAATGQQFGVQEIMLPLGISFFTFTQIAFLVDTFQDKVKEFNFSHYLLFVTYFPHLIAGPVLHHGEMMPQFSQHKNYAVNWDHMADGIVLFTLGLCKKTLWADSFAPYASAVFDGVARGEVPTIYEAWSGALAYTMQIYFDFSGYTDMALGIALMFNIRLPQNFKSPYKATSIIEFWRCWHMTLSRFLRDYLYIPLGGSRKGKIRRYANLMATMLLGGLWHGAGWTFVIWGAMHGVYLTVNHLWRGIFEKRQFISLPKQVSNLLGGTVTFLAVVTAWVVFYARDIGQAEVMLKAMYGLEYRYISLEAVINKQLLLSTILSGRELVILLLTSFIWVWFLPNSSKVKFIRGNLRIVLVQVILIMYLLYLCIDHFGNYSPFLYYQF